VMKAVLPSVNARGGGVVLSTAGPVAPVFGQIIVTVR